jgi:hypothetical protein
MEQSSSVVLTAVRDGTREKMSRKESNAVRAPCQLRLMDAVADEGDEKAGSRRQRDRAPSKLSR